MNKRIEFLTDAENALFERNEHAALTFLMARLLGLEYSGEDKYRVSVSAETETNIETRTYYFDKGKPLEFFIMNASVDVVSMPDSMVMKFRTYSVVQPELLKALSAVEQNQTT